MIPPLERSLWKRTLALTHRWLGIGGGLLFVAWFASGIVMMYARMPHLGTLERLERLEPLALDSLATSATQAADLAGMAPERVRVGMLLDRPVFRLALAGRWSTVYADDRPELLLGLEAHEATEVARRFAPDSPAIRYERHLESADQWTLQSTAFLPAHRIALGDAQAARVYVSDATGEIIMKTTAAGRRWAWPGAILHWLYFAPLRRQGEVWLQGLIWLSLLGCVLTGSGLVWGLLRFSSARKYRSSRAASGALTRSPYTGLMKWHHYLGLVFGLFTFTWILSGCLSLEPWGWQTGSAPSRDQQQAVAGGPLDLSRLTPLALRTAGRALANGSSDPRELEFIQFGGEPFLLAYRPPKNSGPPPIREPIAAFLSTVAISDYGLVPLTPEPTVFDRFDRHAVLAAAVKSMPDAELVDETWLDEYDAYYYDRDRLLPLPVLRARFEDPDHTWLYLDPRRGQILRSEVRRTRLNRWLYHGLHSLDFPFLYNRRPLWDLVTLTLCLGGLALSLTPAISGWRRLRQGVRKVFSEEPHGPRDS